MAKDDDPSTFSEVVSGLSGLVFIGALVYLGYLWIADRFADPPPTETLCERLAEAAARKYAEKTYRSRVFDQGGLQFILSDDWKIETEAVEETATETRPRIDGDLGPVLQCAVDVREYHPGRNETNTKRIGYAVEPKADGSGGWYVRLQPIAPSTH